MYDLSDFKKGLKVLLDGEPFTIVDFQHVKPGKGNQFTRTKLKNLITGSNLERTFRSGEKFGVPDVAYKDMNFLYKDDTGYHFMDQTSFEQMSLNEELIGDNKNYLIENLEVQICLFNDRAVGVDLPKSVNLKVAQTDPGFKGNTVTNTYKPATLETGYVVQVPLHINEGDVLKINTADGAYVERSSIG
ncbi:MAG TPA: elongation factor P [Bdellovibrionales bacterium]|nr:elongation factor P [Pseudobdellovibrionaceae bacterium]HAG92155.1 elongation factor P [Bdellovibrionales bacterium]|tara:strand:+ start:7160 stop:7726 length:567 start_codon:yes stop_codon:yes gene_type:complete